MGQDISLDFVTDLPLAGGFDAILTVVDRFSKVRRFLPCNKTITAESTADLLLDRVVPTLGWPKSIVSDRDPRFTAQVWSSLFKRAGTQLKMSTAAHPQTDGDSEVANRVMETYLRAYVSYRQDDWHTFLSLAEMATNAHIHAATGHSPNFIAYGRDLHVPLVWETRPTREPLPVWLEERRVVWACVRDSLADVQHLVASRDDVENRRRLPPFGIGDKVLVDKEFLKSPEERLRPKEKLRAKFSGPYTVLEVIGRNAYRLQLPTANRAHPVLSADALKPYFASTPADGRPPEPRAKTRHGVQDTYNTDGVFDHQCSRGNKWKFLVGWEGFGVADRTWLPISSLVFRSVVNSELLDYLRANAAVGARVLPKLPRGTVL